MKTLEYRHREDERKEWGPGPWDNEPDKRQWSDPETGLPCLIVRNKMGAWCGYVGVDETHPYFGLGYDDIDVDVHGGLTFAGFCAPDDKEHGICHVVEPGENDRVLWFGFDCAHAFDLMPEMLKYEREIPGFPKAESIVTQTVATRGCDLYKDVDYVTAEVTKLAHQLAEAVSSQ